MFLLHLIPQQRAEIAMTSTGLAVFHADVSPRYRHEAGQGRRGFDRASYDLGPTVPRVDPGEAFPTDAPRQVNSPVGVTVNGQSAEVINKIGWPGLVDTYRVDFRVPDGTHAGTASIQLTAAWIPAARHKFRRSDARRPSSSIGLTVLLHSIVKKRRIWPQPEGRKGGGGYL